jgi:hypothetical protein
MELTMTSSESERPATAEPEPATMEPRVEWASASGVRYRYNSYDQHIDYFVEYGGGYWLRAEGYDRGYDGLRSLAARVVALEAALKERKPASDEQVDDAHAEQAVRLARVIVGVVGNAWHAAWRACERFHGIKGDEDGHADVAHGSEETK